MKAAAIGLVLVGTTAHAGPIEIGATLGGHAFSSDVELGVEDRMDEPGPSAGPLIGARAAYAFVPRIAAEGELVVIPTKDDVGGDRATVLGMRVHGRFDVLVGRVRPFLVAGVGMHVLRTSSAQMENDADRAYHWGGGVRYALSPKLELRLDVRHLIVPDRTLDGATSDVEISAGVAFHFGTSKPRPTIEQPHVDVVAAEPGDKDRDGLDDAADQCPTKPEDKDSFEDSDGCPDLDNDADGIVDASDKCPAEPESKNGWQDDDGCKDEVIAELTGIGFELDSAKIDGGSAPLLELAHSILRDHPNLYVEISGHTSSEGNPDKNLELSLRRAHAVKDYLVKRGIAEGRILTVGHGSSVPVAPNDSPEGRSRNRRIEFRILRPDEVPK